MPDPYFAYSAVFDRLREAIVVRGDELTGLALFQRVSSWKGPFREAGLLAVSDVGQRLPRRAKRHFET